MEAVSQSYPQLLDLVNEGVLFVHRRPADYVERREDGYTEPQLVFVVGTAHVSKRSAQDVDRVVRAVRPDSVVVELCKNRSGVLFHDPDAGKTGSSSTSSSSSSSSSTSSRSSSSAQVGSAADGRSRGDGRVSAGPLPASTSASSQPLSAHLEDDGRARGGVLEGRHSAESPPSTSGAEAPLGLGGSPDSSGGGSAGEAAGGGGGGFLARARAAQLGGQSGMMLRLLLDVMYSRASGSLNVSGGADFRAAALAAEATGAQLVLGDRPVEVTLGRAWDALTSQRKAVLARDVLWGAAFAPALTDQMVEEMKQDDMVSKLMQQMRTSYPELMRPFVTERDLYLAWSLKRSKAVNGNTCVVGVVGKAHLRGISYALAHDSGELRFKDLVRRSGARTRRGPAAMVVEVAKASMSWVAADFLLGAGGAQ